MQFLRKSKSGGNEMSTITPPQSHQHDTACSRLYTYSTNCYRIHRDNNKADMLFQYISNKYQDNRHIVRLSMTNSILPATILKYNCIIINFVN